MDADDSNTIAEKLATLRERFLARDDDGVQEAIFDLGACRTGHWHSAPDEIVDGILSLLKQPSSLESPVASHVLNYFEFESRTLTRQQKKLCREFLAKYGDQFSHPQAAHVVMELRYNKYGNWLE